jgi:hypothetical protein
MLKTAQENKNGEGYLGGRLEGRPDLQRRVSGLVSKLQPRVREVEAEFSGRYGWKRNEELNQVYNTEAEELGVDLVEGDHPFSTCIGAKLSIHIAEAAGLCIRFQSEES